MFSCFLVFLLGTKFVYGFANSDHNSTEVPPDPDVGKDMTEIVQSRGYEIETHFVSTRDGYILTMFRIPHRQGVQMPKKRSPILLQHGLLDSSYTWVNNYQRQSLGYILVDAGFDVWSVNSMTKLCNDLLYSLIGLEIIVEIDMAAIMLSKSISLV